jgi:DNA repair exonuclease SbcCD nuclease subunit
MRFIHTADLQIGARFAQFGEEAGVLRQARVQALDRVLAIAEAEAADAVLIAGDLFEDNQVADSLVREVIDVLNAHSNVPVVILPGNHDPVSGPGCIWMRSPFDAPPDHVTVCTSTAPVEIGDAVILPSPITQKRSTRDPALPLVDLAGSVAAGKIKIGLTHGSLAIESKHQPDDHPMALNAATRAGLDYLAVGHWHSFMAMDEGRLVMPGTPEPDQFGQAAAGVVMVDVDGPGASPTVKPMPSATFGWHECPVNVAADGDVETLVASAIADVDGAPETVVLRIRLHGATDPVRRRDFEAVAAALSATYAVVQVQDETVIRLSDTMWQAWQQEHPLLAQVVADVEQARLFATGTAPDVAAEGLAVLTLPELRGICSEIGLADSALDADVLETARELLIGEMSAVAAEESTS